MGVNDVLEVVLGFTQDGEKMINRLHYVQTTIDGSQPPNADLANGVLLQLWVAMKLAMSNRASLQTIRVRRLSPTEGGSFILNVDEAGSVAVDPLPPNSCAVITLKTATPTKKGRGRIHVSGVPDSFHANGVIDVATQAIYQGIADTLANDITPAGGAEYRAIIWNPTDDVAHQILFGEVRTHLYTLRSRRMENP